MIFTGTGGGISFSVENVCYAAAVLLALALVRIWIFYRFQMKAIELIAPLIKKAKCRQLHGDSDSFPAFRLGFRSDLGMIFDLSKWRFRDFYPDFDHEKER